MNRITSIIIGGALALTVTAANAADDQSANFVMPGCRAAIANALPSQAGLAFHAGLCMGLVIGIRAATYKRTDNLCADVPNGVTNEQLVRVVVRYIEMRPQDMHQPFIGLAMLAMVAAWPCRK
jgi:hypothetical protein